MIAKGFFEQRHRVHDALREVDVDDRIYLPVVIGTAEIQSVEEFALAAENGFEGRDRQALAEPARAGAEELAFRDFEQFVDVSGLVDVEAVIFDEVGKCVDRGRDFFQIRCIHLASSLPFCSCSFCL